MVKYESEVPLGCLESHWSGHRQAERHDRLMLIQTSLPAGCAEGKGRSHPSIRNTGPANCGSSASGTRGRLIVVDSGQASASAGAVTIQPQPIRNNLRPSICMSP